MLKNKMRYVQGNLFGLEEKIEEPDKTTTVERFVNGIDYAKFWEYSKRLRINVKEPLASMKRKKEILGECKIKYVWDNNLSDSENEYNIDALFCYHYKKAEKLYGHCR